MNTRREFLLALGAGALVPLASPAQPARIARIGFIAGGGGSEFAGWVGVFQARLRELGYVEGRNLAIEYRWAEGQYDRLPALAAELVQANVDVIVGIGTPGVGAMRKVTATLPIVMANVSDPVSSGFVKNLARPEGNITGLSNIAGDLSSKQLEMILGIEPRPARVAVLMNPNNAAHAPAVESMRGAEQKAKVKILPAEARDPQEIETAFSRMAAEKARAVIVLADSVNVQGRRQIAELAAKLRLPSIDPFPEYAKAGGLMSYGADQEDLWRRVATLVDKILKGAKPGDLPIEQPTKFELVVNLKTAKALGITIPQSILVRADKVIE